MLQFENMLAIEIGKKCGTFAVSRRMTAFSYR